MRRRAGVVHRLRIDACGSALGQENAFWELGRARIRGASYHTKHKSHGLHSPPTHA